MWADGCTISNIKTGGLEKSVSDRFLTGLSSTRRESSIAGLSSKRMLLNDKLSVLAHKKTMSKPPKTCGGKKTDGIVGAKTSKKKKR